MSYLNNDNLEAKEGDLVVFWDDGYPMEYLVDHYKSPHTDTSGCQWKNQAELTAVEGFSIFWDTENPSYYMIGVYSNTDEEEQHYIKNLYTGYDHIEDLTTWMKRR